MNGSAIATQSQRKSLTTTRQASAPNYMTDLATPGSIRGLDYIFNDGTLWLNSDSGQTLRLDAKEGVISVVIFDGPVEIHTR